MGIAVQCFDDAWIEPLKLGQDAMPDAVPSVAEIGIGGVFTPCQLAFDGIGMDVRP